MVPTNGIANILSLARLRQQGYGIMYSSENDNEFIVKKKDGTVRIFKQSMRYLWQLKIFLGRLWDRLKERP
jgi:hypothetical protein